MRNYDIIFVLTVKYAKEHRASETYKTSVLKTTRKLPLAEAQSALGKQQK